MAHPGGADPVRPAVDSVRQVAELEELLLVKPVPWAGLAARLVFAGFTVATGAGIGIG
ncbi:hypothetical protein [Micropruina sp.]|uniref:hypothetical protein n=1 Tax=Micropruina sp. TaxID=2737536 RepID=UPI0039E5F491